MDWAEKVIDWPFKCQESILREAFDLVKRKEVESFHFDGLLEAGFVQVEWFLHTYSLTHTHFHIHKVCRRKHAWWHVYTLHQQVLKYYRKGDLHANTQTFMQIPGHFRCVCVWVWVWVRVCVSLFLIPATPFSRLPSLPPSIILKAMDLMGRLLNGSEVARCKHLAELLKCPNMNAHLKCLKAFKSQDTFFKKTGTLNFQDFSQVFTLMCFMFVIVYHRGTHAHWSFFVHSDCSYRCFDK